MAFFVFTSSATLGQDQTAPAPNEVTLALNEAARRPLTPSDTSSFRATLHSFIDACNEVYDLAASTGAGTNVTVRLLPAFDRIRDCLDLSASTGDLRDSVGMTDILICFELSLTA